MDSIASIGATKLDGYGYGYSFIDGFFDKATIGTTIGDLFLNGLAYETKKVEADNSLSLQKKNALLNTMAAFSKRAALLGDPALKVFE